MKIILSLLFAGIVGVIAWGWVAIESTHRFKASLGVPPSIEGTIGKRTNLLVRLAGGLVIFLSSITITSEGLWLLPWAGAFLLAFFLFDASWNIKRALDKQRSDLAP